MDDGTRTELEAAAFRALRDHLRERTDVQNIDLMNLAGFCRNCLSRWYQEAADERGRRDGQGRGARDRLRHALRRLGGAAPDRGVAGGARGLRQRAARGLSAGRPSSVGQAEERVLAAAGQADRVGVDRGDLHALDAVAGLHLLDVAVRQPDQGVAAVGAGEDARPARRCRGKGRPAAWRASASTGFCGARPGYGSHRLARLAHLLGPCARGPASPAPSWHRRHRRRPSRGRASPPASAAPAPGRRRLPRCHDARHLSLRGGLLTSGCTGARLRRGGDRLRGGPPGAGSRRPARASAAGERRRAGGRRSARPRLPRRRRWRRRCSPA